MRIIGGRDYYDSALAYGHDEHVTYVRGREELAVPEAEALGIEPAEIAIRLVPAGGTRQEHLYHPAHGVFSEVTVRGVHYQQNATTVIACGTRYQGVRVTRWSADPSRGEVSYFWNRARLEAWLAENRLGLEPRRHSADLDAWFQPARLPDDVQAAIIGRRWTILVHDPPGSWYGPATVLWRVDQPVLNEVQFYRVVPPNEMFQEIEMWIGGRLAAAGPPMLEISDEVRLAKHGMDKTSFRKPKSKR